ncbi:hypothetical protein [Yinghuangia sp. YIM S09857]|uniref:hypothetical protein n=1 Tax=Yinghuangia sp. YIM S09857 TaxID=3436929 RepID=UPI003F53CB92
MDVCSLVDLQPLSALLQSPGYEYGPKSIPKGTGVDAGGPQCAAQIKLPPLRSVSGRQATTIPARINVAVVMYSTLDETNTQFEARTKQSKDLPGTVAADFPGTWTRGMVLSNNGDSDRLIYVLVQTDRLLVKIELQVESDHYYLDKLPATLDQIKDQVVAMMRDDAYPSVQTALAG